MSNALLSFLNDNPYTPVGIPSYEQYNNQPSLYTKEGYEQLLGDDTRRAAEHDARGSAYNSLYFGGDVQRDMIVGQQIMRAAYAVKHMNDEESFGDYLENKMGVVPEQVQLLKSHFSEFKQAFPTDTEFSASGLSEEQTKILGELVKRTHNWGQQKEHFLEAEKHVKSCLNNADFTSFMNSKLESPETLKGGIPPSNAIAGQMGLLDDIGSEVKEGLQIWQATNRFSGIGLDLYKDLVPLKDFSSTPAAFPEKFADDIDEFAKYSQTLVKAFAGIHQAHEMGGLSDDDYSKAQTLGKLVSYHGLNKLQSTMAKSIAARSELKSNTSNEAEIAKIDKYIDKDTLLLNQFKLQQDTLKAHLLEKNPELSNDAGDIALPTQGALASELLSIFGKSLSSLQASVALTGEEFGVAIGYALDKIVPYTGAAQEARDALLQGIGTPTNTLLSVSTPSTEFPFQGPAKAVGI